MLVEKDKRPQFGSDTLHVQSITHIKSVYPLALDFLGMLAVKALSPEHRWQGTYFWVALGVVFLAD